jgi:hypothetical protein
MTVDQMFFMQT